MKHPMSLTALLLTALTTFAAPAAAETLAGYDRLTVSAEHRPTLVAGSVWYPAGRATYQGLIGENGLFTGTPAYMGAAVAKGKYPLIVLSHGSGGNMDGLGWLSSQLAKRGAMVLAVNHPGTTSNDSSPRQTVKLEERAADLSAALDALLSDPAFAPHIDPANIISLGFSLGGTTALNVAGARLDRRKYQEYCAGSGEQADCVFFAKGGVDLGKLPKSFEADMRDARITRAIAVDPGMTKAFSEASIARMTLPVLLINLGGAERWPAVDVSEAGSNLVNRLRDAAYAIMKPANHFTFLAECKPEGPKLLKDIGEDSICTDPEGADRRRVHRQIVDRVADFIGLK